MNRAKASLLKKIHAGQVCQIVATAARLKIFDHFEDECSLFTLATQTQIEASILERFLTALVHLKLLEATKVEHYKTTPEGDLLKTTHPQSLQPIAAYKGGPMVWAAMGKLYEGLTQHSNPFELAHNASLFDYLEEHPDDFTLFHDAMLFYERNSSKQLLENCDFSSITSLLDVGCGMATFLNALIEHHPHIKGAGFDLPSVVERAKYHTPHPLIAGNFFQHVPNQYDAYLLRNILHDWSDKECLKILHTLKKPNAKLLIFETVLSDDPQHRMGRFSDLTMFMLTNDGKERTLSEFQHLLDQAGFTIDKVTHSPNSSKTMITASS